MLRFLEQSWGAAFAPIRSQNSLFSYDGDCNAAQTFIRSLVPFKQALVVPIVTVSLPSWESEGR